MEGDIRVAFSTVRSARRVPWQWGPHSPWAPWSHLHSGQVPLLTLPRTWGWLLKAPCDSSFTEVKEHISRGRKSRALPFHPTSHFFAPFHTFTQHRRDGAKEDCCHSLKKSLTQDHNLDTQLDVLSILFRNNGFGKPFTLIKSLNPLWKLSFPRPPSPPLPG